MTFIPDLEKKYRLASMKDYNSAKAWLTQKVAFLRQATTPALQKFAKGMSGDFGIGQLAFYQYDPLYKEEMVAWDAYPLCLKIGPTDTGWLGLNLHYLPPRQRALLLDRLMDFANNTKMDKTTRIKVTYQMLKGVSRYALFEPCLHAYRRDHLRSKFLVIDPSEWHLVVLSPFQDFRKGGRSKNAGKRYWARKVWGNHGK